MGYIKYELDKNVIAGTTLRTNGVSKQPYDSNNFAFQVGDSYFDVKRNREKLASELKLPLSNIVFVHQTHSTIIKKVTILDKSKGENSFESGVEADAIYTKENNIAIAIFHADCLPIFIYSPEKPLIGIIHAGVKGSLKEVAKISIEYLIKEENIDPSTLKIALGPCISIGHCFLSASDETLVKQLGYGSAIKDNNLDLRKFNIMQLVSLGVNIDNILIYDESTDLNSERFFSVHNSKITGRMTSFIKFK